MGQERIPAYRFRKPCGCRAVALTVSNKWMIHLLALGVEIRLFVNDPPRCTKCGGLWERLGVEIL